MKRVSEPGTPTNPLGHGDPNDKSLRKIEKDVLVAQIMRDKAREFKCPKEASEFGECAKVNGLSMWYKCRKESDTIKACLIRWFEDEDFRKECTEEYLAGRTAYRRDGIKWDKNKYRPKPKPKDETEKSSCTTT